MADKIDTRPMLLALGCASVSKYVNRVELRVEQIPCSLFAQTRQTSFDDLAPRYVLSKLFCDDMDCIEIGQHLHELNFKGQYLILTDALPNPAIIARELRQQCTGLSFEILAPEELPPFLSKSLLISRPDCDLPS